MGVVKERGGQVTIFIIIAILIIGLVVSFYLLIPRVETESVFDVTNPAGFMQSCLEKEIERTVETISLQGGSIEPVNYLLHQDNKVEYLCYTDEWYKTCVVQQPLLKRHIESEIKDDIQEEVATCFANLQQNYRDDRYTVNLETGKTVVELLPKRIVTRFENYVLTVTKGQTSKYDSFSVVLNNNLYELSSIATSIIDWESTYGDAETTIYMTYYKDLKVEKIKLGDGSTVYVLTDRNDGNKFQFASRSVAWPPGYAESITE